MKRLCCALLAFLLAFALACPAAAFNREDISSKAVVLMDADTGEVIFAKNKDRQLYPASITKIMTALLAVEHLDASDTLRVNSSATSIPKGYAHIALASGDTIQVEQALYALMLPSANDAANVLAEEIAGSQSSFAAMMTRRAGEIGASNTTFRNANGIPNKQHLTTAYDMALITREAIKNKEFMEYFSAESADLPSFNAKTKAITVDNHHFMLRTDKDEYDSDVIGGKIGYTPSAGHTMCTVASRNGKTLIVVVLGSGKDSKYEDTSALLEYGFGG